MKHAELTITALFCIALAATLLIFFLGVPLGDRKSVV